MPRNKMKWSIHAKGKGSKMWPLTTGANKENSFWIDFTWFYASLNKWSKSWCSRTVSTETCFISQSKSGRIETSRDESSCDLSPLRGLCGRSMKPEGCFSSRHAEAALWSEQPTTRKLFGKEQSTTQSTPQKLWWWVAKCIDQSYFDHNACRAN